VFHFLHESSGAVRSAGGALSVLPDAS
jgi:hypothetical protein